MTVPMTRIMLADDHAVMRTGLRLVLERQSDFQVVGEASDGREAVAMAQKLAPDVLVMDIGMPNLNGIEAARQLAAAAPQTGDRDSQHAFRRILRAARAQGRREGLPAEGIGGIGSHRRHPRRASGKAFFSPAVSRMLVEDYVRQLQDREIEDSYELLTTREREILQLVAEGKSNKEIAAVLNLSLYTVETHRGNLMEKLGLHTVPELILYAVRKGVIS